MQDVDPIYILLFVGCVVHIELVYMFSFDEIQFHILLYAGCGPYVEVIIYRICPMLNQCICSV